MLFTERTINAVAVKLGPLGYAHILRWHNAIFTIMFPDSIVEWTLSEAMEFFEWDYDEINSVIAKIKTPC